MENLKKLINYEYPMKPGETKKKKNILVVSKLHDIAAIP